MQTGTSDARASSLQTGQTAARVASAVRHRPAGLRQPTGRPIDPGLLGLLRIQLTGDPPLLRAARGKDHRRTRLQRTASLTLSTTFSTFCLKCPAAWST